MENKVNFIAYAENVPDDVNNLQTYVSDSIDHVVMDTLVSQARYSGFLAQKSGPAQVTVAAGRLYKAGKVYALTTPTQYDFISQLPVAAKRIVLISGWGSEVDTGATPRNVLIAAQSTPQNPVYQPQVLEIVHSRVANLGTSIGAEAPDPSPPSIDATLLPIAKVVLTPTGVDSVTMFDENEVPNLEDVGGRVNAIEKWEAVAAPALTSLASDIARLSNDLRNSANQAVTGRMLGRIAVLEAKEGVPSNAADSSADFFLDPATSDLANPVSNYKIQEGVRFADNGASDAALQLFNPLNPLAMVNNGVLFPAYDSMLRFSTGDATGETQISQYTYQTQTLVQKTIARQRVRYGTEFSVCTNSAFWNSGTYDPITQIFKLPNGETFKAGFDLQGMPYIWSGDGRMHIPVRLQQFWTDTVDETYWDRVTTSSNISGSQVAETFPVGQDFWLASIALRFTRLDSQGSVTLALCEATSTGVADVNNVIAQATLPQASLSVAPNKTLFVFDKPVFLQSGKRYGFVVITGGNHFIATTAGNSFGQGMFFAVTGGVPIADPTKHLFAQFNACKFRQSIAAIDLQSLQLAGGITSIDILSGAIAPSSTSLTFEVQIAGQWVSLSYANAGALNAGGSLPPLLPFRAVFAGTPDVMPALDLMHSNVHVSRPNTSYVHVWPAGAGRTTPAPTTQIRLTERYESFDAAFHSVTRKLLTGSGFATETAPSSYSDVATADGALERTYVWNLGAAVSAYKLKGAGTTSTALKTFHGAWLKDWVL
jgi:hypothetical protein